MPRVIFTPHLSRHLDAPPQTVEATTVREALAAAFAANKPLADYIVDERFRMRKHVTIFVDGKPLVDRDEMSDPVGSTSEIYVLQALSGG